MTGKTVQLPWGKATVEEEATIPAACERARRWSSASRA